MWDLYRFDVGDVMAGRRTPEWAWGLMDRLVDEPWSRWRAKQIGGDNWREHVGWSPDTYLTALLTDAQRVGNAIADAARTGKRPNIPTPVPRPSVAKRDEPHVDPGQVISDDELRAAIAELDM